MVQLQNLQKNVAPKTPQFKPVETAHCFTGAFLRTAMVAPVVAPAKAMYIKIDFNALLQLKQFNKKKNLFYLLILIQR